MSANNFEKGSGVYMDRDKFWRITEARRASIFTPRAQKFVEHETDCGLDRLEKRLMQSAEV